MGINKNLSKLLIKIAKEIWQMSLEDYIKSKEDSGIAYWEDHGPTEQKAWLNKRKNQIENLKNLNYPFMANFGHEKVKVLGPHKKFLKEKQFSNIENIITDDGIINTRSEDPEMLLCERDGKRFLALPTSLFVNGSPLVESMPPKRKKGPGKSIRECLLEEDYWASVEKAIANGKPVPFSVRTRYEKEWLGF